MDQTMRERGKGFDRVVRAAMSAQGIGSILELSDMTAMSRTPGIGGSGGTSPDARP